MLEWNMRREQQCVYTQILHMKEHIPFAIVFSSFSIKKKTYK